MCMMDRINYPKDFKERVKEEYPNSPMLHKLVDLGKIQEVGKYLRRVTPKGVKVDFIMGADSLEEVRKEALRILRKQSLFRDWERIYNEFLQEKKHRKPNQDDIHRLHGYRKR